MAEESSFGKKQIFLQKSLRSSLGKTPVEKFPHTQEKPFKKLVDLTIGIGVSLSQMQDFVRSVKISEGWYASKAFALTLVGKKSFSEGENTQVILNRCSMIANRGMQSLGQNLKTLASLKNIRLHFGS